MFAQAAPMRKFGSLRGPTKPSSGGPPTSKLYFPCQSNKNMRYCTVFRALRVPQRTTERAERRFVSSSRRRRATVSQRSSWSSEQGEAKINRKHTWCASLPLYVVQTFHCPIPYPMRPCSFLPHRIGPPGRSSLGRQRSIDGVWSPARRTRKGYE